MSEGADGLVDARAEGDGEDILFKDVFIFAEDKGVDVFASGF